MPRPRKGTADTWYDTYAEWSVEDQAIALKVLEQIHRQNAKTLARAARAARGKTDLEESAAKATTTAEGICPECDGFIKGIHRLGCPRGGSHV